MAREGGGHEDEEEGRGRDRGRERGRGTRTLFLFRWLFASFSRPMCAATPPLLSPALPSQRDARSTVLIVVLRLSSRGPASETSSAEPLCPYSFSAALSSPFFVTEAASAGAAASSAACGSGSCVAASVSPAAPLSPSARCKPALTRSPLSLLLSCSPFSSASSQHTPHCPALPLLCAVCARAAPFRCCASCSTHRRPGQRLCL